MYVYLHQIFYTTTQSEGCVWTSARVISMSGASLTIMILYILMKFSSKNVAMMELIK